MALTIKQIEDIATDIPQVFALYGSIAAAVATLPPTATRKFIDYMTALQVPANSPLFQLAALVDSVEAQIKTP